MSLLRALRAYVGLGPDEDYEVGGFAVSSSRGPDEGRSLANNDEYWNYGAEAPARTSRTKRQTDGPSSRTAEDDEGAFASRRHVEPKPAPRPTSQVPVVDLRTEEEPPPEEWVDEPMDESDGAVIRSLDTVRARPKTVSPESFSEAREVADEFRLGVPVVLHLQGLERDLARRLIDFASGVCYCMDGTMEKVGSGVFLLTPDGVEVADEDRMRIQQRGYAR